MFAILLVEDSEPVRHLLRSRLESRPDLQIVGEAFDGLDAVQKATELKPDLILFDIGLPKLNGLEAAKQVRELDPHAKIIFVSQETSSEVIQVALDLGAEGYVVKSRVWSELLPAIDAVLQGKHFVAATPQNNQSNEFPVGRLRHEVQFYGDDSAFLRGLTRFIATALRADSVAIVAVTKPHQNSLVQSLKSEGLDIDAAIREGTYVALDALDTLSKILVNGMPDRTRCNESMRGLVESASKATKAARPRMATCGELAALLWAEGRTDAALLLERVGNEFCEAHDLDILCSYPFSVCQDGVPFNNLCAEHSAVHYLP